MVPVSKHDTTTKGNNVFTTGPGISVNGTHLQGSVLTTRARIETVFGAPTYDTDDAYDKVMTEWVIAFDNGTVATIYDWKRYESGPVGLDELYDWHIGGASPDAVTKVKALL